ncbi:hypothetical protein H696_01653 [Fonticula alba]|uniref:DHHA2 domain-containing protein n=1 Tax=Fonticula alba TaxID=691883 RepID=A0A058ZCZ4_FONAL|nr:hypothetical protein H696_01653 [Fonticula alba]KCV72254.1 hypothetical protein H696_01653 [Fonticula alba]|eukprot:XP_009493832.1 hypothetical protein H696_01653 [Fonticula alba]
MAAPSTVGRTPLSGFPFCAFLRQTATANTRPPVAVAPAAASATVLPTAANATAHPVGWPVFQPATVVVGNESADLDSAVSAMSYAYYLHQSALHLGTADDRPALPVLNVCRQDLALRTEVTWLLGSFLGLAAAEGADSAGTKASFETLACQDQVDWTTIAAVHLVDHNQPAAQQADLFQGKVRSVLDHRADGGAFPTAAVREILTIGSCATLVAERFLGRSPHTLVPGEISRAWLDPALCVSLLSAILVDTGNLDPALDRATERDVSAARDLGDLLLRSPEATGLLLAQSTVQPTIQNLFRSLFDQAQAAKLDISALSVMDLLRKDYKQVVSAGGLTLGVAAVGLPLGDFLSRLASPDSEGAFAQTLVDFATSHGLDLLGVMTYFPEPTFQRGLVLYSPSADTLARAVDALTLDQDPSFQMSSVDLPMGASEPGALVVAMNQGNIKLSRKQLFPRLIEQL